MLLDISLLWESRRVAADLRYSSPHIFKVPATVRGKCPYDMEVFCSLEIYRG